MKISHFSLSLAALSAQPAFGKLQVDFTEPASVKKGASQIASDLMSFYQPDSPKFQLGLFNTTGDAWYTHSILWSAMLDYRFRTGDKQYDSAISKALRIQRTASLDFNPDVKQGYDDGHGHGHGESTGMAMRDITNMDQSYWALTALLAERTSLPNPGDYPWIVSAKNVFDEQNERKISSSSPSSSSFLTDPDGDDDEKCNGLLRDGISKNSPGHDSFSPYAEILFFRLSAQLAHLTSSSLSKEHSKYIHSANSSYTLLSSLGIIPSSPSSSSSSSNTIPAWDGGGSSSSQTPLSCTDILTRRFSTGGGLSAQTGSLLEGLAYMHNISSSSSPSLSSPNLKPWTSRLLTLLPPALDTFFPPPSSNSNPNSDSFSPLTETPTTISALASLSPGTHEIEYLKSDFVRSLARITELLGGPADTDTDTIREKIKKRLRKSAEAAVGKCDDGPGKGKGEVEEERGGTMCTYEWTKSPSTISVGGIEVPFTAGYDAASEGNALSVLLVGGLK